MARICTSFGVPCRLRRNGCRVVYSYMVLCSKHRMWGFVRRGYAPAGSRRGWSVWRVGAGRGGLAIVMVCGLRVGLAGRVGWDGWGWVGFEAARSTTGYLVVCKWIGRLQGHFLVSILSQCCVDVQVACCPHGVWMHTIPAPCCIAPPHYQRVWMHTTQALLHRFCTLHIALSKPLLQYSTHPPLPRRQCIYTDTHPRR